MPLDFLLVNLKMGFRAVHVIVQWLLYKTKFGVSIDFQLNFMS